MKSGDMDGERKSPYRRFQNSHRRMHANVPIQASAPSSFTDRSYHRNANLAIEKAQEITKQMTQAGINHTPSPKRFEKQTIFDKDKTEVKPQGYRASHNDNRNKVVNNNTEFRIFNNIKPRDKNVAPLEEMNVNMNKWKPRVTYYNQKNMGEITENHDMKKHGGLYNPYSNQSQRNTRLLNSKRKLQNYLDSVTQDPRLMNNRYREQLSSKSALTKLPKHDNSSYAIPEIGRTGPTNKTITNFRQNEIDKSGGGAFKAKNSLP
jgi:hypothetical protein